MSAEFDFGDFIPRDDISLCDTTHRSLSLPAIARTCHVIDRSVGISSYEKICGSMFTMVQHIYSYDLIVIDPSPGSNAAPFSEAGRG
jgi:hypothetical protein